MIQAGFARLDITPPLGTPISGYFYERLAEGVRDPLQLNALAYGNGTQSALIIACDVVAITQEYAELIRTRIAARTGVPDDRVMICALHQHTAICLGGREIFFPVKESVYLETLYRKFEDVAVMALADMSEARVFTAEGEVAEPIAFIRRYYMPDGSIKTNPSRKGPRPVRPCEEADNTVRLIRFAREGKQDIAYVNFSTHPDVISGKQFSADWPGFVRRFVEGDNADALCISVTGFQGDSNHLDFFKPKEERFPHGKAYDHSRYMGRVIADTVKKIWDAGTEHTADRISGAVQTVYNKTNTAGIEYYDEAVQYVKDFEAGTPQNTAHIRDVATAYRIVDLQKAPICQPVAVTVAGLGDIRFVGLGGEPFTAYTHIAHALAKGKTVFCSCCTNGYQGYLPHKRAFDEGGYEVSNTFFTPSLEEQCAAAMQDMLEKF
jgi:hypothetical protein